MPAFTLEISGAGVSTADWLDPTSSPTRLNPQPQHPHRYYRVDATLGAPRFSVRHDTLGFEPLDAALGGNLFIWWWVEQLSLDVLGPLSIPTVVAQSSVALFPAGHFRVPLTGPNNAIGHYLLGCYRSGDGVMAIPILVV